MKDKKKYQIKKQSVALGYGQMISPDEPPIDDVDVLLNGLATWGNLSDEADKAIQSCLLYVAHRDFRVRALAITQLGRLIPYSKKQRSPAVRAVSNAISDIDIAVSDAARTAADLIRAATGIDVEGDSAL